MIVLSAVLIEAFVCIQNHNNYFCKQTIVFCNKSITIAMSNTCVSVSC